MDTTSTRAGSATRVAIVGAGLGGLSAAIHLRAAGYNVDVFEANDSVGGRANVIEADGFRFDTGPSLLNYPWVFRELFEAAGRKLEDYVTLLPVEPSVSFQWPDGTHFTLSSNLEKLLAECTRLEPGASPRVLAYLRDAAAKYDMAFESLVTRNEDNPLKWVGALSPRQMAKLGVWRSLYSELGRFFKSRYIKEALGSYGMYLGGSPHELPGFFSILPYGELAYGLWLPKGGIYGLVSGIERLARDIGVRIHTGRRVTKIRMEHFCVKGLEFADGDRSDASIVVSNVDVPTTDTQLLDANGLSDPLRRKSTRTRMTCGVLTFYWGIRGKVENMRHHTIYLPDDYRGAFDDLMHNHRIPRGLPFYVSVPSETDPGLAPDGDTAMFVLVPTPLLSEMPDCDWRAAAQEVKAQVLARMAQHGVSLDPGRIAFETTYTPEDWRDRFGLYDGSAFGAAHNFFQVGPFRAKNYLESVKGMYYVGASTTPGTGMPMVVLGGRLTAERIQAHAH